MRNNAQDHRADGPIEGPVHVAGLDEEPEASDVVFDFSDLDQMRIQDLTVLLTASQLARNEDRTVWAAGVAMHTWRTLHAMGLGGYFKPFPTSGVQES